MASVQKSDAMLQHEKWIAWVTDNNPKWIPGREKKVLLFPETHILMLGFAAVAVVAAVALSLHL